MSLENFSQSGLPGMGPKIEQAVRKFLTDTVHMVARGMRIDDAVVDSGNTPTTKLRAGLALVRVEAVGANQGKFVQIGHADAPAAVDIKRALLLLEFVNMLDEAGVAKDQAASGLVHGFVKESDVIFGTADAPTIAAIKAALPLVDFE